MSSRSCCGFRRTNLWCPFLFRLTHLESNADAMPKHHVKTSSTVRVEPPNPHHRVDRYYSVGRYSAWGGGCHSGMNVAPDAYVLYLPYSGSMAMDIGRNRLLATPQIGFLGDMSHFESLTLHHDCSHIGLAFERSAITQQLCELLEGPATGNIKFVGVVDLATVKGSRLAALGNLVWNCLDVDDADQLLPAAIEHLFRTVMIALLEVIPNNYLPLLTRPVSPAIPRRLK